MNEGGKQTWENSISGFKCNIVRKWTHFVVHRTVSEALTRKKDFIKLIDDPKKCQKQDLKKKSYCCLLVTFDLWSLIKDLFQKSAQWYKVKRLQKTYINLLYHESKRPCMNVSQWELMRDHSRVLRNRNEPVQCLKQHDRPAEEINILIRQLHSKNSPVVSQGSWWISHGAGGRIGTHRHTHLCTHGWRKPLVWHWPLNWVKGTDGLCGFARD